EIKTQASGISIHELIARAMPDLLLGRRDRKKGLADSTKSNYRLAAKILVREVFEENIPAKSVVSRHVQRAKKMLQDEPGTFNNVIPVLRGIQDFGILEGLVDVDFCRGIQQIPVKPRTRYVTHDEYKAIYLAGDEFTQVLQELSYRCGQRNGDVRYI